MQKVNCVGMGSRYYQRPENAISKADEFMKVGKFYHGNVKHKRESKFGCALVSQLFDLTDFTG